MGHVRRGFTLIELLVVVSIIALLISILLPSLGRAKELANRVHCSANIRGIVGSFIVYAADSNEEFPVSIGPETARLRSYNPLLAPTPPMSPVPVAPLGSLNSTYNYIMTMVPPGTDHRGDVFSPFYMLTMMQLAQSKMFICKSDRQAGGPAQLKSGNYFYDGFQDKSQICYSIPYPWSGSSRAPWWRNTLESQRVVMSDMAPYEDASGYKKPAAGTGKIANSENHDGAGQNVGYGDNHVSWERNPRCGPTGDNIFTLLQSTSDTQGLAISGDGKSLPGASALPTFDDVIMVPTRSSADYELK